MEAQSIFFRPDESYLFFPRNQMFKDKRLFFYGKVNHTPKEQKFITTFRQYLKKIKSDLNVSDQKIVLFGYDKEFKTEKTYQALKLNEDWKKTNLPIQLTPDIEQILKSGIIYMTGRDHMYRPIVVMNLNLFQEKKTDLIIKSFSYFFEQVIDKILIPGQVQQWVTIMNIKGFSLFSLPLGGGKKLLNHLETHYRGRLAKLYLVNSPSAVWLSWKIVKQFLQDSTVEKVDIIKDNDIKELYKHANKSQIEKQFGGTQPDRVIFWPGQKSPNDFLPGGVNFGDIHVSKEEYIKRIPGMGHDIIQPKIRDELSNKEKQPQPQKLIQKKVEKQQPADELTSVESKPSSETSSQNIQTTIKVTPASEQVSQVTEPTKVVFQESESSTQKKQE